MDLILNWSYLFFLLLLQIISTDLFDEEAYKNNCLFIQRVDLYHVRTSVAVNEARRMDSA